MSNLSERLRNAIGTYALAFRSGDRRLFGDRQRVDALLAAVEELEANQIPGRCATCKHLDTDDEGDKVCRRHGIWFWSSDVEAELNSHFCAAYEKGA